MPGVRLFRNFPAPDTSGPAPLTSATENSAMQAASQT